MGAAKAPRVAVVDFETKPILPAPAYPPEPVGVSIWLPGSKPRYLAWGHPCENNCTREDGLRALRQVWDGRDGVVFHHAKFDLRVAEDRLGLRPLPWDRAHDTMFLLFLDDPYRQELDLKGAAEAVLGMPPDERDELREWAIAQKLMPRTRKNAGEFIHLMPGGLVGRYANGDTLRTGRLFSRLWPSVVADRGMGEAYDRERRLLPVLMANEREGIRADLDLLRAQAKLYGSAADAEKFGTPDMFSGGATDRCDALLRKALRSRDLNIDSDADLADALVRAGKADPDGFLLTPKGKRSVAKDSVLQAVTDHKVLGLLQYRARLSTAKNTFLLPWLREAEESGGRVFPSWNQVRQHGAAGDAGTKTGRLSASRFMNVPKPFVEQAGKFEHPAWSGLPELPAVRRYLLPERGHVWGKRDYAQQELRVLAHFEDGVLLSEYLKDVSLDVHALAAKMVSDMGVPVTRGAMKTIGFGLLYGMGLGSLAERLGVDVATAKQLKAAYLDIFPGLDELIGNLTDIGKQGEPMRTWGGRLYLTEPARYSEKYGRVQSFEYKLINYLIQGSSADCTKEAIIRYDGARRDGRFRVTVHDEINISCPARALRREMLLLRDVMASIEFDVPMLSDGSSGDSWGQLSKLEEPPYDAASSTYVPAAA